MITSLSINGFKSIRSLDNFKLNNINILIGANGAGKSNFIGFFKLMKEMSEGNLSFYSRKQGGANSLFHFGSKVTKSLNVEIKNNGFNAGFPDNTLSFSLYAANDNALIADKYHLLLDVGGEPVVSSFPGSLFEQGSTDVAILDFFQYQLYHFHDTGDSSKIKGMQRYNDNLFLKPNAENIAPYLDMLHRKYPENYQKIVNVIRLILPFFGGFIHREGEKWIELEWYQKHHRDTPLNAYALSDGSLRFICLATLLLQPAEKMPNTILIDDPELGLHPTAIAILCELIQSVSMETQVIVGTQSAELLNHFSIDDVIVVHNQTGESVFQRLEDSQFTEWLEDYTVGDLWLKNVISAGISYE